MIPRLQRSRGHLRARAAMRPRRIRPRPRPGRARGDAAVPRAEPSPLSRVPRFRSAPDARGVFDEGFGRSVEGFEGWFGRRVEGFGFGRRLSARRVRERGAGAGARGPGGDAPQLRDALPRRGPRRERGAVRVADPSNQRVPPRRREREPRLAHGHVQPSGVGGVGVGVVVVALRFVALRIAVLPLRIVVLLLLVVLERVRRGRADSALQAHAARLEDDRRVGGVWAENPRERLLRLVPPLSRPPRRRRRGASRAPPRRRRSLGRGPRAARLRGRSPPVPWASASPTARRARRRGRPKVREASRGSPRKTPRERATNARVRSNRRSWRRREGGGRERRFLRPPRSRTRRGAEARARGAEARARGRQTPPFLLRLPTTEKTLARRRFRRRASPPRRRRR